MRTFLSNLIVCAVTASVIAHGRSGGGIYTAVFQEGFDGCDGTLILIAAWGDCKSERIADLNADGTVNIEDLLQLISEWS